MVDASAAGNGGGVSVRYAGTANARTFMYITQHTDFALRALPCAP